MATTRAGLDPAARTRAGRISRSAPSRSRVCGCRRGREDLLSLAEFNELAVKEKGDAIREAARLREAMGHDHLREIRPESDELMLDQRRRRWVERGAWLVEEDRLGPGREHPREAQALLLTARERQRGLVEPFS